LEREGIDYARDGNVYEREGNSYERNGNGYGREDEDYDRKDGNYDNEERNYDNKDGNYDRDDVHFFKQGADFFSGGIKFEKREPVQFFLTKPNFKKMATQMEPRPVPQYNEAMAVLYAALNIAWDSQAEHEAEFLAENTLYTAGLAVTRKAAIAAAQALPDGQARGTEAEVLRITLTEKHDVIIGKWNSLDGYISKAFKGAYYKPRIEEAGKQYYEKAANQNWEFWKQLLVSAKNFIAAHNAVLLADGGMPAGFAASVDTVKTEFEGLYSQFKDAQQDSQEQTDAKINANNAIYKEGREMMEDGKRIFRKNASVRDRFIWERTVELVTPSVADGTATVEGDLAPGAVAGINYTGWHGTSATRIKLFAMLSTMHYYASNMAGGPPMTPGFIVNPNDVQEYAGDEFGDLIGLSETNPFLCVQNTGMVAGHYKLTANHLSS